jgi:hypothetical protein
MMRFPPVVLACLAAAVVASASCAAEDLMDVYREAQRNDPTLAGARANWEATQERVPQARAGLLPNVSLTASTNANYFGTGIDTDPHVSVNRGFGFGGLTVSAAQPLYRYANTVAYSQAVEQVRQADYTLSSARQDLILRVAGAYFDVLLAQFNVELTESQKAAVSEQLAQAKRNFEVGVATITDTNEAQAKFDSIVAQEISAGNDHRPLSAGSQAPGTRIRADAAVSQRTRRLGRSRAVRQSRGQDRTVQRRHRDARDRAPARGPAADDRSGRERQRAGLQRIRIAFNECLRRAAPGRDRPRADRSALPGRFRRFESARSACAAGCCPAEPRGGPAQCAFQRPDRIHRRHERGSVGQGVRAGACFGADGL